MNRADGSLSFLLCRHLCEMEGCFIYNSFKRGVPMNFRYAEESDLKTIVAMLADDELGKKRESVSEDIDEEYIQSFRDIEAQKGNQILLSEEGEIGRASCRERDKSRGEKK